MRSLDTFAAELRTEIESFVRDYKAKHSDSPDYYPLELPDDNAGLWEEFFLTYLNSGEL